MPIGEFELELLRLLARNRNPDSFVGGSTVLLRYPNTPRESLDVDIFHDTAASLKNSSELDLAVLRAAGFEVNLVSEHETFRRGAIRGSGQASKIEWVFDSPFRFFPVEPDLELGYRLNLWDVATNKLLALVGRREIRDYLDVVYLHQNHLHLAALAWAAAGKDPGLSPEFILDWCTRNTRYRPEDLADIRLSRPIDLKETKKALLEAVAEAEALIEKLPPSEMGCLYLDSNCQPVCPDPDSAEFPKLTRHFGSVKGAWPRISE